jgi:uncharacterized membrane protein
MNQNPLSPTPIDADARLVEENVRKINALVHQLLIVGLAAAAVLMVAGVLLGLFTGQGLPDAMVPLSNLLAELARFNPAAFISLGLLALIATPILRVAGSIVGFAIERDWRYALITTVVLIIVILSIVLGQA